MSNYPLTALHFQVQWGDDDDAVNFSEVSGLTMESEPIEYRGGADKQLSPRKIPGLKKYGNVTLKRGIMNSANGFWEWWNTLQAGAVERRDVTVSLLNEDHDPVMTWQMSQAWPVKIEGPSLDGTGNEIAIETLEFAHEGLKIST